MKTMQFTSLARCDRKSSPNRRAVIASKQPRLLEQFLF